MHAENLGKSIAPERNTQQKKMLQFTLLSIFFIQTAGYTGIEEKGLECPRECDQFCVQSNYGPVCSCRAGYRLYDDLKTCVLTEEMLEEAAEEMAEEMAFPVAIILIVGFIVVLCMAIITWYCVTRDSTAVQSHHVSSLPIHKSSKPLHISIV